MARLQQSGTAVLQAVGSWKNTLYTVGSGVNLYVDYVSLSAPSTALTATQRIYLELGVTNAFNAVNFTLNGQGLFVATFAKPIIVQASDTIVLNSNLSGGSYSIYWAIAGDLN